MFLVLKFSVFELMKDNLVLFTPANFEQTMETLKICKLWKLIHLFEFLLCMCVSVCLSLCLSVCVVCVLSNYFIISRFRVHHLNSVWYTTLIPVTLHHSRIVFCKLVLVLKHSTSSAKSVMVWIVLENVLYKSQFMFITWARGPWLGGLS